MACLLMCMAFVRLQSQNLDDLEFGTDSTFEVMTWNIEWFPKDGMNTVYYVSQIISALDVDLIAVQEIDDKTKFGQMVANLDGWDAYFMYGEYQGLAYIYRTESVEVLDAYEIFTGEGRPFPRPPYVLEILYEGVSFVIINNHLKCCGDGYMNLYDTWDEETRRFDACNMLDDYISLEFPNDRVILLGDLNDILTDQTDNNVFETFLSRPSEYVFADMQIATSSSADWSFPGWPSHLDHILITNELFPLFYDEATTVETIKIDDYFPGGMESYDWYVSDHRPVAMRLYPDESFDIEEAVNSEYRIDIFPNPAIEKVNIYVEHANQLSSIELYSCSGERVFEKKR